MKVRKTSDSGVSHKWRDVVLPYLQKRLGNVYYWIRHPNRPFNLLGIPVAANDFRLRALKDRHKGQRCFIIGNGPSLQISDLDRLKGEVTFACNKIYLAFDQTDWRPTYYSVLDVLVAEQNVTQIKRLNLYKIFDMEVKRFMPDLKDATWVVTMWSGELNIRFSKNLLKGAYGGGTVLYTQLQMAFYMGIREVYLIGVDFSFLVPKPTGETSIHGEVIAHQGEMNHFHPKYRKLDEKWTMPRLDIQRKAFCCAKEVFETYGGIIYNASRKTALDVFPLLDFDTVVQG